MGQRETCAFADQDYRSIEQNGVAEAFGEKKITKNKKAISTRVSRAVPHLSTNLALCRLTSEFGWDPVL